MKKNVMVTGGAGFIGHHLVKKLVELDYTVYIVDDLSNSVINVQEYFGQNDTRTVLGGLLNHYNHSKDTKGSSVVFVNSDFANPYVLESVASGRFETVFHLAAKPSVEWSVQNPLKSTDENFMKSLHLATACANSKTRFIFSSTAAVYGNGEILPTTETDPTVPESPYGLAKLCTEKYLALFEKLYNLDWAALRYFNVYGPAQPGGSPYSTVVSAWCHKAIANEPLRSDGDGEQTRDMIHVDDVVSANIAVACASSLEDRVFNVGSEISVSNNYIRRLFKNRGYDMVEHAPKRLGDVLQTKSDTTRLKKLGWKCNTDFEDGIKNVLDYWKL
jgi:UDP-glucose 4-epimerase